MGHEKPFGQRISRRNDKILITEDALAKLRLIAALMDDEEFRVVAVGGRGNMPIYSDGDSNGQGTAHNDDVAPFGKLDAAYDGWFIEDFRIPSGQRRDAGRVITPGRFLLDELDALEKEGRVAVGLAHGHGRHPAFYSLDDHLAFDGQLDLIGHAPLACEHTDYSFYRGDGIPQLFLAREADATALALPAIRCVSLLFPDGIYAEDEVRAFARQVRLRMRRTRKEIASIVINSKGDLFGIKRYEEAFPWLILESIPDAMAYADKAFSDYPDQAVMRGCVMRYSRNADIITVPGKQHLTPREDDVRRELEERLDGDVPWRRRRLTHLAGRLVGCGRRVVEGIFREGTRTLRQIATEARPGSDAQDAIDAHSGHQGYLGCEVPEFHVLRCTDLAGLEELLDSYTAQLDMIGRTRYDAAASRQDALGQAYLAAASAAHALDALLADASLPPEARHGFEEARVQYALWRLAARDGAKSYAASLNNQGQQSLKEMMQAIGPTGLDDDRAMLKKAASQYETAGNLFLAIGEREKGLQAHHAAHSLRMRQKMAAELLVDQETERISSPGGA